MINPEYENFIRDKLYDHYAESLSYYNEDQIVGIFLCGLQNYGLNIEEGKFTTKLLIIPSAAAVEQNNIVASSYHKTINDEFINFEDINIFFDFIKEQDLNEIDTLFTNYYFINPMYEELWDALIAKNELIARMKEYDMIHNMVKEAVTAYRYLQKPFSDKQYLIPKYGYDPSQLFKIVRLEECLTKYASNFCYSGCIQCVNPDLMRSILLGEIPEDKAISMAVEALKNMNQIQEAYCKSHNKNVILAEAEDTVQTVQDSILAKYMDANVQGE